MAPADRAPAAARGWRWLLALLLALAAVVAHAHPEDEPPLFRRPGMAQVPPVDAPRIGVLTMEPGEVFFERFGHNAIVVAAPGAEPIAYNFGFFDMREEGFVGEFIAGRMRYMLVALPLAEDLESYRRSGRGVGLQWLDLEPAQARAIAEALAVNARPENARYTYDYYLSNCSTRVRDALDAALGGALRAQLEGRSRGLTYRSESVRLAWPAKWMATGFDVGMGAYGDRPLSRWEEAFIPMRLRDSLREAHGTTGRPLVAEELEVLPNRVESPPEAMPRTEGRAFIAGAVLALLALWGARRHRRATALFALAFWTTCALAGATMAFIWFGTAHVAGHANLNLLLLPPWALALLPGGFALARGRAPSRRFDVALWVVAGGAALAGFAQFLPFLAQRNMSWVLLLLPLHLALARGFTRPAALVAPAAASG